MSPLRDHLARGRKQIVQRAAAAFGLRGAAVGGLSAGLVALLARLGDAEPRHAMLIVILGLLVGGAVGVISGARRGRRGWSDCWDRCLGLPQSVATAADLEARQEEGHESLPRECAFLEFALTLPLPSQGRLQAVLPVAPRRIVMALIGVAVLSGFALAWPGIGSSAEWAPPGKVAERARRALAVLGERPETAAAREALSTLESGRGLRDDREVRRAFRRARALLDELRQREKQKSDARSKAADWLEPHDELIPITDWLRGTGPEPTAERLVTPLSDAARAAIQKAARALESGDGNEAASWLRELARVSLDTIPPEVPRIEDWGQGWRQAERALGILEGASASNLFDPAFLEGSDRSRGSSAPTSGRTEETGEAATEERARLAPGARSETGDRIIEGADGVVSSEGPHWERALARPEIEARWRRVVEAYCELRTSKGDDR